MVRRSIDASGGKRPRKIKWFGKSAAWPLRPPMAWKSLRDKRGRAESRVSGCDANGGVAITTTALRASHRDSRTAAPAPF